METPESQSNGGEKYSIIKLDLTLLEIFGIMDIRRLEGEKEHSILWHLPVMGDDFDVNCNNYTRLNFVFLGGIVTYIHGTYYLK